MTWAEVDLENRTWTILTQRMKAGKEHRVPLISDALSQLGQRSDDTDLVFGSETKNRQAVIRYEHGPKPAMGCVYSVCQRLEIFL